MKQKLVLKLDVENCFPTVTRQLVLDMVQGKVSVDCPNTLYKKGDALPTHPSFCDALPLYHLLYGFSTRLKHHFPGREAEFVEFVEGHSQGCPTGAQLAMLDLHLAMHIALSKHHRWVVRSGGAGVRENNPRFGCRVVTDFTTLHIIISHYKPIIKLYNIIIFNNIIIIYSYYTFIYYI